MNNVSISNGVNQLAIFQGKRIRSLKHQDEWWYSVVDVIEVLTDSPRPRKYWSALKNKLNQEGSEVSQNVGQLKMIAEDGKERLTDAMKVEDILRLIQSIPSPKAEPFKQWLAKVGHERLQEHQNPDLIIKRAFLQYKAKGYDDEWIKFRVNNIIGRRQLEGEWVDRGIKNGKEFALLTDAISMQAFGVKTRKHKEIKSLGKSHNLRDNMTNLELLFTSLAEQSTIKIARTRNAQGYVENEIAAKAGGRIAGEARKSLETELEEGVVSSQNYLTDKQKQNQRKVFASGGKKFTSMIEASIHTSGDSE